MNYFITQNWQSTKGNHAGMVHLCNLMKQQHPADIKHIVLPTFSFRNSRPLYHIMYFLLGIYLGLKSKKDDKLFLMEYLFPTRRQDFVAYWVKKFSNCRVIALAHLTPADLDVYYKDASVMQKWCDKVDVLMTLGSSLTKYINERCVNVNIKTAFHYVDSDYYSPLSSKKFDKKRAIIMGNVKRDYNSIEKIVASCPEVDFVYLKGESKNNTDSLNKYNNIRCLGYVSENELRQEMDMCNISLNLMIDTVGSNVITTSLAMGLCMFVSDVGSIRDYCDSSCSIFCQNTDDVIQNLNSITIEEVRTMSAEAVNKSKNLTAANFYRLINSL